MMLGPGSKKGLDEWGYDYPSLSSNDLFAKEVGHRSPTSAVNQERPPQSIINVRSIFYRVLCAPPSLLRR